MKALVLEDIGKFAMKEVPAPQPTAGEVQINIKAVSICGSDVHGYDGTSGRRKPPVVIGHEASGIVTKVGSDVTKFKPGDSVVFNSVKYCRDCYYCKRGMLNVCDNGSCYGVHTDTVHLDGAMCEYLCVPDYIVYKMPDGISFETAALIEPLSIACHAVGALNIGLNDTGIVFGAGIIGLMMLKVLKTTGCRKVIMVDLDQNKLQLAENNGADYIIDGREDVPAKIKEITDGLGADFALEAVGVSATITNALNSLKKGGTLVQVGNVSQKVELPLQTIVSNEIKIQGRYGTATEYEIGLELVSSGKVSLDDCLSVVAPLEEGQKWFDKLHNPKVVAEEGLIKVVLKP